MLTLTLSACDRSESLQVDPFEPTAETVSTPDPDDSIERISESGPVSATVSVSPSEPILGDPIVLTLAVEAEPDVEVVLPAFGEALGRFSIVDFSPRQEVRSDGSFSASQRYTLQPPMSGRQRIPPLRITFTDHRSGSAPSGDDDVHEILTDEIALVVASVLPEDDDASLRPALGALPPRIVRPASRSPWLWVGIGAGALLLAAVAIIFTRRALALRRRRTAYDIAMARLDKLRSRGLPKPDEIDAWYVDLSSIVRRYLENRFGLRAPELTTEEFLREAHRSADLGEVHRELLSAFLAHCDQVKFAGYRPSATESMNAIDEAVRFVEETRLVDESREKMVGEAPAAAR